MSHSERRTIGVVLVGLVVLSAGSVAGAAQSDRPVTEQSAFETLTSVAEAYNEEASGQHVGPVKYVLAGERVNVYVADGSGGERFSFVVTDRMRIYDLRAEHRRDATVRMETDRATVERIMRSDRPLAAFGRAYASGDIRISGTNEDAVAQVTWTVVEVVKTPLRFLF